DCQAAESGLRLHRIHSRSVSRAAPQRPSQERFSVSVLAASLISAADLSKLASFGDDAARVEFLARHPDLQDPAIVEQIAEAVREQVRVDVHKADALADAAVLIARDIDDPATIARALRAKANAKWHLNELKSAVELFDQAIELFDIAGDRAELGRTLSSSIQSLILLGEYSRALAAADRARTIFETLGDDRRLPRL